MMTTTRTTTVRKLRHIMTPPPCFPTIELISHAFLGSVPPHARRVSGPASANAGWLLVGACDPMLVGCWLVLAIRCYDRLRSLDLDFLAVFRRRVIQATSGSTSRARRPSGRSYSGTPPCPSAPQTMKPSGRQMWVTASNVFILFFSFLPFPHFFWGGQRLVPAPFSPLPSLSLFQRDSVNW